jgi:hypothetical protein
VPTRRLCLVLLALAGCRTAPVPELRLGASVAPVAAADFPAAPAVLQGFDPPTPGDRDWRVGDEVLFGLRLRVGGDRRHWLLHLRVSEAVATARAGDGSGLPVGEPLPPVDWTINVNGAPQQFQSRRARIQVTVHDHGGAVLGCSEPQVPRDLLANGFAAACDLVQRQRRAMPHTIGTDAFYQGLDLQPLASATVCAVALLQVVQDDAVLSPLLWEVIERPSVWSVLRHLGARVVLRPRFHAAIEVPRPGPPAPRRAWQVPMTLLVNDAPVLLTELVVGEPLPPFALGGSLIGATARHPQDGEREFALQLLAARRGPRP